MIKIQQLSFGYRQKSILFKDLELTLNKGHIYGLFGKNGAGKSTLLKIISGLTFPTAGFCLMNDQNVSKRSVSILKDIYFISEELFVPSLTPAAYASRTAGFYSKFSHSDFHQYLEALDVDLHAIMDKSSFGQQKKALIAFGLATHTNLLIMDEPTNGLDIPSKIQFRKLIASVLNEDRCIIISTHQVRDLDSLIDTVLVLHEREITINKSIEKLSEVLSFKTVSESKGLEILYEEESVKGKQIIMKNESSEGGKVDLELFFNAVISGNHEILHVLNHK